MAHFVQTDDTGRILVTTDNVDYAGEEMYGFTFPDDFDFSVQNEYRIVDGELVHDPMPPSEEELAAQEEAERREQMQTATLLFVRSSAATMTDAECLSASLLFEDWRADTKYKSDTVLRHGGELYRVAQDHTSQSQWEPGAEGTESLYTRITVDPETGYDVWKRPTGAHDAYNTGDRVLYPDSDGKVYESTIDGNTWSPEEYPDGWEEVSE